jgi:hypothetical protein
MTLKVDFVNGAYKRARISGLTKSPTPEELETGLDILETMASEFQERNICTGYNFEDTPDLNSVHNVERKYWNAYETNLAARLWSDFYGDKPIPPTLVANMRQAFSLLSSSTAQVRSTQYPSRQPIGSGNNLRRYSWRQYYSPVAEAPISCATNKMIVDNVDDFVEHFDAYLNDGEVISSYTIEADTGLTIVSSSNATPDINYRIRADGTSSEELNTLFQVKIVVTTDDSRVETRLINFELTEVEL